MAINFSRFFDAVRPQLFSGSLSRSQVSGTEAIISAYRARGQVDRRWLAYALATAYHETAHTMQPIREYGGPDYYHRMYDPLSDLPERAALARSVGAQPGDGVKFYGRGYVQLTWRVNYKRMGELLGLDLEGQPDMALDAGAAAQIMFEGMERGSFTGKKLGDYFSGDTRCDWVGARRIINGSDKAQTIAIYAQAFHLALQA